MAYTALTSRRISAGTVVTSSYGAATDARNYGPGVNGGVMGWFTAKASSTNVEILELYKETGQSLSLYSDFITNIPTQSGVRIIRPAGIPGEPSWQGHNRTPLTGVGFSTTATTDTAGIYLNAPNIHIYDLIIDSPSLKMGIFMYTTALGATNIVGNIIRRTGATPNGISHTGVRISSMSTTSTTLRVVNNIIIGFYHGVAGTSGRTDNVIYNNTMLNLVSAPFVYDSIAANAKQLIANIYNNTWYNCPVASTYHPSAVVVSNVALNSTTDFVDHSNQDYGISATASEVINQGVNMSSDATFAFDDDINNDLRPATWDIGADEYVITMANLNFSFARNIEGFMDVIAARDVSGFVDLSFARNIGDVFTEITFTLARNISGFIDAVFARDVLGFVDLSFSRHIYGTVAGYSNFTPYFRDNIFKAVFGVASYSPPNLYLGLSTTDPLSDGSGITEPSGGGYGRVHVSAWGTPYNGIVANSTAVRMPKASGNWGVIPYIFWSDAPSGGNVIAVGRLFDPLAINGTPEDSLWTVFQVGSLKMGLGDDIFYAFANNLLNSITDRTAIPTGDISYGLLLSRPNVNGTYSEVAAAGYSRVTHNDIELVGSVYTNPTSINFPVVTSGNNWGTVTNHIIFIGNSPLAFGVTNNVVVDNSTYGVTGFRIPANTIVIEVV